MRGLDIPIIRRGLGISEGTAEMVPGERLAELLNRAKSIFDTLAELYGEVSTEDQPITSSEDGIDVTSRSLSIKPNHGLDLLRETGKKVGELSVEKTVYQLLVEGEWAQDLSYADAYSVVLRPEGKSDDKELFSLIPMATGDDIEFDANLLGKTHEDVLYGEAAMAQQASDILDRMSADLA